jgi:hypothetical protein
MGLFKPKAKVMIKNASLIVAAILLLVTQAHGQENITELPVAAYQSASLNRECGQPRRGNNRKYSGGSRRCSKERSVDRKT